jgi:hypothetical protein
MIEESTKFSTLSKSSKASHGATALKFFCLADKRLIARYLGHFGDGSKISEVAKFLAAVDETIHCVYTDITMSYHGLGRSRRFRDFSWKRTQ